MEIVYKQDTKEFKNDTNCLAIEYPMKNKNINGSIIKISGRYPEKGLVLNEVCQELVYVTEGNGKIVVNGQHYELEQGDSILVESGEKYYWEGFFTLFIASTPAWYLGQHKIIKN